MADNSPVVQSTSPGHEVTQDDLSIPSATKRRKKDETERRRVSRACDRCKSKKTRCNGRQPCPVCTRTGSLCEFTAAYTRGRLPRIPRDDEGHAEPEGMQPASGFIERVVSVSGAEIPIEHQPPPTLLQNPLANHHGDVSLGQSGTSMRQLPLSNLDQASSRVESSRNSPEPPQTDLQGHYVGPSSGVSFLLRVQKKLHQKVSFSQNSSIFTFGDAPLPEFDPSFLVLPPKEEAERLVARYFDFAIATHRFLHRPTVEGWLEDFYNGVGVMRQKDGARERTALLFMVFAQATEHLPGDKRPNGVDTSARYFQLADHQLSSETGEIRLTSVQARLCQCFYLLSRSRVNHCWSLFGTMAHLILAIGIHRKRRVETSNGADLVELECRKRVFWCAYGLDNYLSAVLGRPRTFHDDDIDQELPTIVNDCDLTPRRINISSSRGQSIMLGAVAHNTLSKILSNILRDLYSIRPPALAFRVTLSAKYSKALHEWRRELSRFLDADTVDASLLIPAFQRQRNVLNLAYYHALILVYRPFLLSNFASLNSRKDRPRGAPGTLEMDKNVADCLDAAMNITTIVNELCEAGQLYRAFWFTQYFAFCAVVVLYVYTIQQANTTNDKYRFQFMAAERCQDQIAGMAVGGSLAQRYSVVLEELRIEAIKQTQRQQEVHNRAHINSIVQSDVPTPQLHTQSGESIVVSESNPDGLQGSVDMFPLSDPAAFNNGPNSATPSSLIAELTSWGEFDSLATAGMGGLDFVFIGDQHRAWDGGEVNDVQGMMLQ